MGISEVRMRDALLRSAGAGDLLTDALALGSEAWDNNSALSKEASERYKTTESQLQLLKNGAVDLGISFGEVMLPVIKDLADSLSGLAKWFSDLSPGMKKTILVIAGIAAAIGPLLLILGLMASGVSSIIGLVGIVGPIIGGLAAPIAIAIAAIAAIVAIGVLLYKNWDTIKEKASELWSSITATFDNIKTAVSDKMAAMGDAVRGAIEKIKGFFSFKWELPKIKLPHFDLKGKFSFIPPQVPKLSVNWYKDGGIFANPSVIGVGEAGTEAVLPIDKLDSILAKALEKVGGGTMDHTGTITVKGVTDNGQTVAVANIVMDQLRKENRR
jgi:hypothetical protein